MQIGSVSLCLSADGRDMALANRDNFDSNYFSIFDGRTVPGYLEQITRAATVNLVGNDAYGGKVAATVTPTASDKTYNQNDLL